MTDLQKSLYKVATDLSLWMETVGTVTIDESHLYNIGTRLHDSLDELANTCADGGDRVIEDTNRPDQVQTEQNAPKQCANGYSRDLVEQMYNALMLAREYLEHEHTPYDSICPACAVDRAIAAYRAETKETKND